MKINTKDIARIAIVASIYVAASLAISPLSFGAIQFRFAEVLVLFVVYNRKYALSLILGCFVVNIFSPLGIVDMLFGTLATTLTCLAMMPIKNLYVASVLPTVFCIIIGAELYFVTGAPFWITSLTVMLGEFVVVSILGCMIMNLIIRNKNLVSLLGFNRNLPKYKNNSPPYNQEDKLQNNKTLANSGQDSNIMDNQNSSDDGIISQDDLQNDNDNKE